MQSIHKKDAMIFKALCDEKRLCILEMLRNGEHCACSLIDSLQIKQSALSYHMKILCESGIVSARQDGKWTYYKINSSGSSYAIQRLRMITTVHSNKVASKCE